MQSKKSSKALHILVYINEKDMMGQEKAYFDKLYMIKFYELILFVTFGPVNEILIV